MTQRSLLVSLSAFNASFDDHAQPRAVIATTGAPRWIDLGVAEMSSHATERAPNTSRFEAPPKGGEGRTRASSQALHRDPSNRPRGPASVLELERCMRLHRNPTTSRLVAHADGVDGADEPGHVAAVPPSRAIDWLRDCRR